MTRFTRPAGAALNSGLGLALLIGPVECDGLSDEDLAVGWRYRGEQVMDDYGGPRCSRPWGWWQFEAGEEMPPDRADETVRLAELGHLTDGELAALRRRATEARLRVGTTHERISGGDSLDRCDLDLCERVDAALGRGPA